MRLSTTAENLYDLADKYGYYAGLVILIIGLIGNICLILIFINVKHFRNNQCSFYLTIEACSNVGMLLTIYPTRILNQILGYDSLLVSLPWCKIRTMLAQIFGVCSLFTICCTCFDQYLATNHRYSFRQMSTMKLASRLTMFNMIFSFLHSIVFLIFVEIQNLVGCAVYHPVMRKYLSFFYYPILVNALPVIVTITFSLLAYRNVRRIVRRQIPIVRRRLDRQLTAMVLARVICFIILGIPFICVSLYELNLNNSEENYMELAIAALVGTICYSLLYANFSVNFYVFLAISTRFRRQVKHFFFKQCGRLFKCSCVGHWTHVNGNQVAPTSTIEGTISTIESV